MKILDGGTSLARVVALIPRLTMALILLAACESSSHALQPVSLSTIDNGRTVSVHIGQKVTVSLAGTYWSVPRSSDTRVLEVAGPGGVAASPDCTRGGGCGVTIGSFEAVGGGQAQLTSSRAVCGEALRCVPGQRFYQVTVVVAS